MYGGAAGGGKTFGLLLDAAKPERIRNGGYGAVIFRRTSKQVRNEGGLWDESVKLYSLIGATPRRSFLTWEFDSGAKVTFAHLQHEENKLDWQGAQVPYIGFDELTHFTESQFFYLLSRNRSMSGVKPVVRATCNPAPGWVKAFLAPWLDKGYPHPALSGEVRWFVRENGQILWVDEGHRDEDGQPPKSVTFIRSTIHDNQALLAVNPEYLTNLKSLPLVEQARLLHGDWDVFEGAFFDEWSEARHAVTPPYTVDSPPPAWWHFFGGLDWGYADPFAFVLCAMDEGGAVHVLESTQAPGLTNEAQADRVRGILAKWRVPLDKCLILYDPTMEARKTINAVRGEPDIEAYRRAGLYCAPGDNNRQAGWSQVRAFLHTEGKFQAYKGYNADLIRLFPMAQYHETKLEDMAHDEACHLMDALRYGLMHWPRPGTDPDAPKPPKPDRWQLLDEQYRKRAKGYKI